MCMSDVSATEDNFGGRQPKGRKGVSLRVQAGKERLKAGGGEPLGSEGNLKANTFATPHFEQPRTKFQDT